MKEEPRSACVCAPVDAAVKVSSALATADWRRSFEILDLDREQLALLETAGLWDDIGAACGVHIDLFEEAEVRPESVGRIVECVDRARSSAPAAAPILDRLRALAMAAGRRGAPVLFLF